MIRCQRCWTVIRNRRYQSVFRVTTIASRIRIMRKNRKRTPFLLEGRHSHQQWKMETSAIRIASAAIRAIRERCPTEILPKPPDQVFHQSDHQARHQLPPMVIALPAVHPTIRTTVATLAPEALAVSPIRISTVPRRELLWQELLIG